ncbi:MAG: HU family DNA-binding protein [Dysgonamonadaceae bacterium]|jgi:DNA-binding protein HU-beta|nr:HU family DNA-binding protein [Dysgonamonadaceae bacterium]
MTHKDFVAELAKRLDWTQAKTADALDAAIDLINEKLAGNAQVSFPNFGTFETKKMSPRVSVNPLTQERFLVPPKIVANFKPATGLKDRLQDNLRTR